MRIGIIGASGAGLYLAALLKLKHKEYEVTLIDKNNKLGKKVLATGNGRCNLLNKNISYESFNHPNFVKIIDPKLELNELISTLNKIGIYTTNIDEYLYPLSLSADGLVKSLETLIKKLDVKVQLDTKILSYTGTSLCTDKGTLTFDKLVFCTGGKSQQKLGSDGELQGIFNSHGYKIEQLQPILCPVVTTEDTKAIAGVRHKANVKGIYEGKTVFDEDGEILFKDDGLSGIVIFNLSRAIYSLKNVIIKVDLFPEYKEAELTKIIDDEKAILEDSFLNGILPIKLATFVKSKRNKSCNLSHLMKNLEFHYVKNYGFDDSQVTRGGISVENLTENLESKFEKNVYFAGEVIDIDGPCGGFNLGWCLICAKKLSEIL